jgi:anti-sigma B factor antagonist
MNIERVQIGFKAVLHVAGRMNAENSAHFELECGSCMSEGFTSLIVDLGDLVYISSAGLRSVITVAKKLKDKGGVLRICRLSGMVRQVFEITNLTKVFPLHDSVESALAED